MSTPVIAVSCGEPSGIGPELAEAAWDRLQASLPFVWIGDPAHLPGRVPHEIVARPAEAAAVADRALPVLALPFDGPRVPGRTQPAQARGVIAAIEAGVRAVQSGEAAALCTLPIHKAALAEGAGFAFPGHTEFLADLAGGVEVAMMLASERLRVVPATIHIPLAEVPDALTAEGLATTIRLTDAALRDRFGIARPRIAVAGLNPHAGEGGRIGREEIDLITPVMAGLVEEGLTLTGPHSADTLFHDAARARYDAVVAMYHDQALIPIKTLDFDAGVNVTLGLPFVRTSPDYGTALDIAGMGRANPASTVAALRMAARMAGGTA
jgi:4-hydroxythreonine-4-phosphate dehydrogenase